MKERKKFKVSDRRSSFGYAASGINHLIRYEYNAWIHIAIGMAVIILSISLGISRYEWIAVIFSIGMVLTAECINTAIELMADYICAKQDSTIKTIKDVAAGAVLLASITAATIGSLVFIPYLVVLF